MQYSSIHLFKFCIVYTSINTPIWYCKCKHLHVDEQILACKYSIQSVQSMQLCAQIFNYFIYLFFILPSEHNSKLTGHSYLLEFILIENTISFFSCLVQCVSCRLFLIICEILKQLFFFFRKGY